MAEKQQFPNPENGGLETPQNQGENVQNQHFETAETIPQIEVTVTGKCKSKGLYVGLIKKRRDELGVEVGDVVQVVIDGQKKLYTVGKGSKEHGGKNSEMMLCTANHIDAGMDIIVQATKAEKIEIPKYSVRIGVENPPTNMTDAAKQETYREKQAKRMQKIAERGPKDIDTEAYLVLPDPLCRLLQMDRATETNRGRVGTKKVRFAGKTVELGIVPAGKQIGISTQAAEALEIPEMISELQVRIDEQDGENILVID